MSTQTDSRATPVERIRGYPRLEDLGIVGDGDTTALIGRDGGVEFLCAPRFDSPPLFCPLLDPRAGGRFTVAPEGLRAAHHRYEPDRPILVTEMHGPDGVVRVTDLMPLRAGADLTEDVPAARGELLRIAEVVHGRVRLRVDVEPRGGADHRPAASGGAIHPRDRSLPQLQLECERHLDGPRAVLDMRAGERACLLLRWGPAGPHADHPDPDRLLQATRDAWDRWVEHIAFDGTHAQQVHRSAITLKLLDRFATGGLVAAPTSSLPEEVGGARNWDYRYTWVRDAALSVMAFRRIGMGHEARAFLGWVLDLVEAEDRVRIMYTTDGAQVPDERIDEGLAGYRGSRPVRWGNGAVHQRQHDVYGELLDCAWQWARQGGGVGDRLWQRLCGHAATAAAVWRQPDAGIWEVRGQERRFTYSAALCHVALDRAARLADGRGDGDAGRRWRADAATIRDEILRCAWDERRGALVDRLDGTGALDASLLALPLRGVVAADHPRMRATVDAIARELGSDGGLIRRYLPGEYHDGVEGEEGAFLLCSFWLVDCLAAQGRLDEAQDLFDGLCRRASPLGLLPEQIDPATGGFTGNYPQAFSHIGLISSAVILDRGGDIPDDPL